MADDKKKKRDPLNMLIISLCGALAAVWLFGVLLNMLAHWWWIVILLVAIGIISWLFIRERRNHAEYRRTHP